MEVRPQILGSNVTRCLLLSFEVISTFCWYLIHFIRKLDITDIVQRLDISKTGYLTHLVNVSDIFLYVIHFVFQEVKFASHILFRYFGIFNVSFGWLDIINSTGWSQVRVWMMETGFSKKDKIRKNFYWLIYTSDAAILNIFLIKIITCITANWLSRQ